MPTLPHDLGSLGLFLAVYFVTTVFTTVIGGGGGVLLLGVMGSFVPAAAVIPLHAVLLLNGNVWRAFKRRQAIRWHFLKPILLGVLIGTVLGGSLNLQLPEDWLQLTIAALMLYGTWAPKSQQEWPAALKVVAALGHGFFSSAFGMGGLLQALVRRQPWDKHAKLATLSACMLVVSLSKVTFFGLSGFHYWPYLPLLVGGLLVGFVGVQVGLKIFHKLSEQQFNLVSDWLITLLALNLLRKAAGF